MFTVPNLILLAGVIFLTVEFYKRYRLYVLTHSVSHPESCPCCGISWLSIFNKIPVTYDENHPHYYDGISEWKCSRCSTRVGRWSGKILLHYQTEPPFGDEHIE